MLSACHTINRIFMQQPQFFSVDLYWTQTKPQVRPHWVIVDGLAPDILYEIRVVAKNGNFKNSLETTSPVIRVRK